MSNSVVYIANNKRYVDKAIRSYRSLKQHNEEVHAWLITTDTDNITDNVFDDTMIVSQVHTGHGPKLDGFMYKVQCMKHMFKFTDRCIFLDSDTHVVSDITTVFDNLDYYDFACMTAPADQERPEIDNKKYTSIIPYNTGVLAARRTKTSIDALNIWYMRYLDKYKNKNKGTDQPCFNEAVMLSSARVCELSNIYNARLNFMLNINGDVKIIHCHATLDQGPQLAERVNTRPGNRIWLPKKGII
jgi:alpha-N-acetylglucosamine transferase